MESELVYTRGRAASRVTAALGIFIYVCIFMGHWIFGTGYMPVLLTQIAPSTSIWDLCVRAAQVYCPGVFYRRELLSCSNYDCRFLTLLRLPSLMAQCTAKGFVWEPYPPKYPNTTETDLGPDIAAPATTKCCFLDAGILSLGVVSQRVQTPCCFPLLDAGTQVSRACLLGIVCQGQVPY